MSKWMRYVTLSGIIILLTSWITSAQTFTVEGRVVDDAGNGVAGVEVFLGLLGTTFEARYTCTNAEGFYTFTEVPDVPLISAVGPDIDSADICSHADYDTTSGDPLVIQFYNSQSRADSRNTFAVADSPINYTVTTWDTGGHPVFRNLVLQAHRTMSRDFSTGNLTNFYRRMNTISRLAQRFEDRGLISTATEMSIITNANNYLTISN
ncbi:MAG: carboxypeptidase-like regulatory domain-containing protein [Chloroflexota bacterium]